MRQTTENLNSGETVSPAERELIEALLKYPSLDKVFDPADERRFQKMKEKMRATADDLERVVRRGSRADAAKAAQVVEGINVTLAFLDDLDARRRS